MIPQVAIVGRPNVGKSSLMNLLAKRRISIVDPTAGVTRDRVSTRVQLPAVDPKGPLQVIELIDTGGYGIEDVHNLTTQIEAQITQALTTAQVILFVIDAQAGIVPLDREVAKLLRIADQPTPVLLVANKVDSQLLEPAALEATSLGLGQPLMVSSTTGHNKSALIEAILSHIDPDAQSDSDADAGLLLAIAGKRNAGKSTLVNALDGSDRVIVSQTQGTTRDSIDVRMEINGQIITAIDTAGVRKTKSIDGDIEYYSHHRTLRSIRRADVVLLLIDAAVQVSQVDKQLANEILAHYKPCIIVLNKWDLAQERFTQEKYAQYLDLALKGLRFAPIAYVSAINREGLSDVLAVASNLHKQAGHRVPTAQINKVMEQVLSENTPSSKIGRRPKIYYATQLSTHPPTIGLFVNNPEMFDAAYQRFLINRFRDLLPFSEVPIKLLIRGKKSIPAEERISRSRTS